MSARDFFYLLGIVFATVAIFFSAIFTAYYGNSVWECHAWHAHTGETTQVIAGNCFVYDGAKWELYGTHVRNHHVDLRQ
jgi:hypothetical protein